MPIKIPSFPTAESAQPLKKVIEWVAEQMGVNEYHVAQTMTYFLEGIINRVSMGDGVSIPGFGIFVPYALLKTSRRKIPYCVPVFSPSRGFRNSVKLTAPYSMKWREKHETHKANNRRGKRPRKERMMGFTAMNAMRIAFESNARKEGFDDINSPDGGIKG